MGIVHGTLPVQRVKKQEFILFVDLRYRLDDVQSHCSDYFKFAGSRLGRAFL